MQITIKFTDDSANRTLWFLRKRYKSKAGLARLAKLAILKEAGNEAQKELDKIGIRIELEVGDASKHQSL